MKSNGALMMAIQLQKAKFIKKMIWFWSISWIGKLAQQLNVAPGMFSFNRKIESSGRFFKLFSFFLKMID